MRPCMKLTTRLARWAAARSKSSPGRRSPSISTSAPDRDGHNTDMTDDDLPASEAARARRRDRDMEAERRALLRPGMAKVFRQVTDAAAKPPTPGQQKAKRAKQK